MPPHPNLDYAANPRRWQKRKLLCSWLMVSIVVVLALLTCLWRLDLREYAEKWYWDYRCGTYSTPSSFVAYEPDATKALKLLSSDRSYTEIRTTSDTLSAGHIPMPWRKTHPNFWIQTIIFMHERRSPAGHSRLIVVYAQDGVGASGNRQVFLRGQALETSYTEWPGAWNSPNPLCELPYPVRIYSGQAESARKSYFSIGYDVNGRNGIIDGWLNDDDTVKLHIRDGNP